MKTIEEKAREYATSKIPEAIDKYQNAPRNEFRDMLAEIYFAGANEALSGQWRPFSGDNSPYVGQEVLILGETGDVILAKIIEQPIKPFGHTLVWHPEVKCKVTHWLPIPEPPKDERE